MPIVGSHQQAPVTIPINGTSPISADEVRLNDNAIINNYNSHDNDGTLHIQSSSLATRPLPGTAGRLWLVTDNQQLYYDTGAAWVTLKLDATSLTSGTVPTARVAGAYDGITSVGTLDDLDVTGPVTAGSFAGPLTGNVTGNVTGDVTGNVSGNAGGNAATATELQSARTFAITGDVAGSVLSNLASGATINVVYSGTLPINKGGTGLTATPTDGQLLIGNGTGFTLATLTAGNQIAITNTPGGISIAATGAASGVGGTGTVNKLPRWDTTSTIVDSAVEDNGTKVVLGRAQVQLGTLTYVVPTVAGAANTALVNDGSGNLSWASVAPISTPITPTTIAPYEVTTADVGKRLVVNSTVQGGINFTPANTNAIPVGSSIQIASLGASTQLNTTDGTLEQLLLDDLGVSGRVNAVVQQSDGRLIVGGQFTGANGVSRNNILRVNLDNTIDATYNPNVTGSVSALLLQSDGKLLVAGPITAVGGAVRWGLARLNVDGSLDTSFADPGISLGGVAATVWALAQQSDGKVIIAGAFDTVMSTSRNLIARLNADLTLDTGYNPNADNSVFSVALQADGKAVFGGAFTLIGGNTRNRIARVNTDGSLDTGFNPNCNNVVRAVAVQADGSVLLAGEFTTVGGTTRNRLARVSSAGALDTGYNPNANGIARAIVLQSDGKAVVGGDFTTVGGTARNYLARLNTDGTLDTGYNPNANNSVYALALRSDGRVYVGGDFTTVDSTTLTRLALLNTNGTVGTTFNIGASGQVTCFARQADGKMIVGGGFGTIAGATRNYIARLNADGTLDSGFAPPAPDSLVRAVVIQSDGKIVLAGDFLNLGATARNRIARLNTDGTLDTGYDPNANASVYALALTADGKIVAGGNFTTMTGTTRARVARINTNGTLDSGFVPPATLNGLVAAIIVQSDNKVIIGGTMTTGVTTMGRLQENGSVDSPAYPVSAPSGGSTAINALIQQADGKVIALGVFTTVATLTRNGVARYNTDGSLDLNYNPNASGVTAAALQSDGKLWIGGAFTSAGGTTRNRIARINTDGTLDSWVTLSAQNNVTAFGFQTDRNVLIGGLFTSINNTTRSRIARVIASTDVVVAPYGGATTLAQHTVITVEKTAANRWLVTESNCS